MKVIAFVAQKGGAGKSTLAAHLSVELSKQDKKVVAFDLDRQASLFHWSRQRKVPAPEVYKVPFVELQNYMDAAIEDGLDYVILDTPPHAGAQLAEVLAIANLVVVPLRPSFFDLSALGETYRLLKSAPHLAVLNQVPARGREEDEVRELLSREVPELKLATTSLRTRKAYATALIAGMSVTELQPHPIKAADEMCNLVTEIKDAVR